MIAEVLVEYNVKSLDRTFDYKIPDTITNLKIGNQVCVPFGSSKISGFVVNIKNGDVTNLKEIIKIINEKVCLTDELLKLGYFMKKVTLCSLISAYQAMFPSGLKIKSSSNNYQLYDEYIILNENVDINSFINNNKRKKKQIEIIEYLKKNNDVLKNKLNGEPLRNLIEDNIVLVVKKEKSRTININSASSIIHKLNEEQNNAYKKIKSSLNQKKVFLLNGVTGSGKTEVYLHLIKDVLNSGKSAIFLVPEISLTAQMIKYIHDWFNDDVAVFHSSLNDGEKFDEYMKIVEGKVHVVVGTRSAIFVPLTNLGIIIIDEEHSDNYKQDNNPRYNAIDMAKFRAEYNNIPLILGSATPSLETMARAKKGVYELLEMKKRVNNFKLPNVLIVDMSEEMKKRNTIFSDLLIDKINERLEKQEQIILLLNRRGYSTIVTCQNCGYTYKCPHCDIALTYHKSSNNMRCHYCGYTLFKEELCANCHEDGLKEFGLGTDKLEQELNKIFNNARIVRMDTDTTSKKGMHEKIISEFKDYKYDILVGTQMISKGLNFPKVSLVGVLNADSSLNIPDFRSGERTFELLTQVSGRAGRFLDNGEVVIQTFNPDNYVFKCIKNNNYDAYYNYEMDIRKTLKYPPYYYLLSIKIASKSYEDASRESKNVINYLKKNLVNEIILGPTPASMFKVNNIYRFQIIIKYRNFDNISSFLNNLSDLYKTNKSVNLEIDNNPLRM